MSDIASDLISNIEGYQQLITTLSLGVAAGAFALLFQIIMHNAKEPNKVIISYIPLIFIGIFTTLLSILFGVFTKSALVSSVPALHQIDWGNESATKYLSDANLNHIMVFAGMQIIAFLLGVTVLLIALIMNRKLLI